MTKTSSPTPVYYSDYSDDLRSAGPAFMLLAVFLQQSSNAIGFFRLRSDMVASALGMTIAEIDDALPTLEKIGFLRYHAETQMVWLTNHAACTIGKLRATSRTMIAQANAEFAAIPKNCPMRVDFLWKHALMLRLEIQGAAPASDTDIEREDAMLPDLFPRYAPKQFLHDRLKESDV